MYRRSIVIIVLLSLSGFAPALRAQVLQPPARRGGAPPDVNRLRQELSLGLSLLGGYDDNLIAPLRGSVVGLIGSPRPSGYVGFSDATLRYWLGHRVRSLDINGRGYGNTSHNLGLNPSYGGEVSASARTAIGRRTQLAASQHISFDPFFTLATFGPLQGVAGAYVPNSNPTNALAEHRSRTSSTTGSLTHQLTRRTSTDVSYVFQERTDSDGVSLDSRAQAGSLAISRLFGRRLGLRASYQYSDGRYIRQDGLRRDVNNQGIDIGLHYSRNLSPTRSVSFSGGAGATQVDTLHGLTLEPLHYWAPSGYASARIDFRRSWSIAADYRTAVSVLQGVNPNLSTVNAAAFHVGGLIIDRIQGVVAGAYSTGTVGAGPVGAGHYETSTGTAQLRIQLTRSWSSIVSYTRFDYRLNSVASHALGVISEVQRNAVRVGFAWSVPLVGSRVPRPVPSAN